MFATIMAHAALPLKSRAVVRRPRTVPGDLPSVSVIVPCYNYGRYLPDCVQSVLDQPGVQVDLLLIDDASPDGSAAVVRRLASQDNRVRAICHEVNRGHIATYNEGLACAAGEFVVLLSADDKLTPGSLARATALMRCHPSVGLTYGFALDFSDTFLPTARTEASSWVVWRGHDWIAHRCRTGHNVLRSPEAVVRTSVLREIGGGYVASLPHTADFELWMRAATVSDIAFIGGADQAYYRIHSANMHTSNFDLISDIKGRLDAFDAVFGERSELLPDVESLRENAYRTLAREALQHAISAYGEGVAGRQRAEKLVGLAVEIWPGSKRFTEWRMLGRMQQMKEIRIRRDPGLILHEKKRSLGYSLNWWRWRIAGVY